MLAMTRCTDCDLELSNQSRDGDPLCGQCATDRDASRAYRECVTDEPKNPRFIPIETIDLSDALRRKGKA